MGCSSSQEGKDPLLGDNEEDQPIFEELKLVLIGSKGAGKSTIANAILKEKVFTFWTSFRSVHIKETRRVSGTKIHLARTPGWKGDLSRSERTKREIVYCVQTLYKTGPHAIILVLNVKSVLSESNISTLESLLTVQLWKHTIVLFTDGEKLGHCSIEDHIISKQLQTLIDKCGQRYFVIRKNDSNQIIERIEELVVRKNSTSYFKLSAQTEDKNTLLSDWKYVVERIKSKISSLSAFKEKIQKTDSTKMLLNAKDTEIRRLKKIVQEKETEIARLQSEYSRIHDLDLSGLHRRNTELEDQVYMMSTDLKKKNKENETLKKQVKELKKKLQMKQEKPIYWRKSEDQYTTVHAGYKRKLCQSVLAVSKRNYSQIQLQALHSKCSALHGWSDTLLNILKQLSEEELKEMKYYMHWNEEYRISRSSVEHRDRVELADQMLKQWGEWRSVKITRDLVKKIPRNDDAMKELFEPFLKIIGEPW